MSCQPEYQTASLRPPRNLGQQDCSTDVSARVACRDILLKYPCVPTHSATRVMVDPLPENSAMLLTTEAAALASKHKQVMWRAGRAPARLRPSRAELTCSSTATTAVQSSQHYSHYRSTVTKTTGSNPTLRESHGWHGHDNAYHAFHVHHASLPSAGEEARRIGCLRTPNSQLQPSTCKITPTNRTPTPK
jgi:hypothetical protein